MGKPVSTPRRFNSVPVAPSSKRSLPFIIHQFPFTEGTRGSGLLIVHGYPTPHFFSRGAALACVHNEQPDQACDNDGSG